MLGIKEWSSDPHVAAVALQDGSRSLRANLLGTKCFGSAAALNGHFRMGAYIVNPGHDSIGRDEPTIRVGLNQDHRCRPLLARSAARGGEEVRGFASDAETEQRGHNDVDHSTAKPEMVGLRHRHILHCSVCRCTGEEPFQLTWIARDWSVSANSCRCGAGVVGFRLHRRARVLRALPSVSRWRRRPCCPSPPRPFRRRERPRAPLSPPLKSEKARGHRGDGTKPPPRRGGRQD